MARRFFLSCRPCRLMYAQSFLITSVRGSGLLPTTSASAALGRMAFMKAGFGFRLVVFFAFLRAGRFAAFFRLDFRADFFRAAAIVDLPSEGENDVDRARAPAPSPPKVRKSVGVAIGKSGFSPRQGDSGPVPAPRGRPARRSPSLGGRTPYGALPTRGIQVYSFTPRPRRRGSHARLFAAAGARAALRRAGRAPARRTALRGGQRRALAPDGLLRPAGRFRRGRRAPDRGGTQRRRVRRAGRRPA